MWLNLPIKTENSTVRIFVVMFNKNYEAGKISLVECFLVLRSTGDD